MYAALGVPRASRLNAMYTASEVPPTSRLERGARGISSATCIVSKRDVRGISSATYIVLNAMGSARCTSLVYSGQRTRPHTSCLERGVRGHCSALTVF